ncbi:FtsB family cell division protein [Chitinivibrio alkaliphilus]|uniref:Cell division protein FtsB n=1 Tax=Chitinivibrio alkaliphilus ACht1 TaxID=1313304 RepID=U7DA11_9BACT|nr:septum formation initiator family protein [Chitinivibrio alkaliphilus]ERP38832.1 cell division protein FtsB [Chitinivibrio alkaliphilus ACht1]
MKSLLKYIRIRDILLLLFLLWGGNFIFGTRGVIALQRIERANERRQQEIHRYTQKLDSLTTYAELLEKDTTYIRRMVKQNMGYIDSGERIIRFVDEE